MIVQASTGVTRGFDKSRRLLPAPSDPEANAERALRTAVPACRKPVPRGRALPSWPGAAFLAHLALQYHDRTERARARRQRLADAHDAYGAAARETAGSVPTGRTRDFHA